MKERAPMKPLVEGDPVTNTYCKPCKRDYKTRPNYLFHRRTVHKIASRGQFKTSATVVEDKRKAANREYAKQYYRANKKKLLFQKHASRIKRRGIVSPGNTSLHFQPSLNGHLQFQATYCPNCKSMIYTAIKQVQVEE